MKNSELIKTNRQLQKSLNSENAKFYNDLLLYTRYQSIGRDEQVIETQLLGILQDLLEAQNDQMSAEQYFGKNVKAIIDDLLSEIPRSGWCLLRDMLLGIVCYAGAFLLVALINAEQVLDLGAIGLSGTYFGVVVAGLFRHLGNTIYASGTSQLKPFIRWSLFYSAIIIGFLIVWTVKTPIQIQLIG